MKIERLQFQNLSFQYEASNPLLTDMTLDLPQNENVLIGGGSGSGKSAVLKILAGLLLPLKGSYLLNGHDVTDMNFEEFLPFRKRIGYSFDSGGLLANKTLWDNLMLPLQYHNELPADEAEARVAELVRRFGLQSAKDRRPAAVSGGLRKATVIARAFAMDPEMLILDDPFVGLDREMISTLLALVDEGRKRGRLKHVFFTSRGEAVSFKLGTCYLLIENQQLRVDESLGHGAERKVANR